MPKGCKYIIFNSEYKCCDKYLYTGEKSKQERHCGFTHSKFNKEGVLTKYILLCNPCRGLKSNDTKNNIEIIDDYMDSI